MSKFETEFKEFTKLDLQQLEFLVQAWDAFAGMGLPRSAMEDSLYSFFCEEWQDDGQKFIEYQGVIELRVIESGFWVQLLYVSDAYRRRGIGKHLLEAAMDYAKRYGALTKVGLGTRPENEAMQALAAKCGMTPSPRVIDYWITPRFR